MADLPYVIIENFKSGLDRRRPAIAGEAGTLYVADNVHITRGGDVEARKKFVAEYSLPSGTLGMHSLGGKLYVFGSAAEPSGMPAQVIYQRLQHSDGSTAMERVLSSQSFDGKIYVIARFADGSIFHYMDTERVYQWDDRAAAATSRADLGNYMAALIDADNAYISSADGDVITITAATAGTAFTLAATYTDAGGTNDQTATTATPTANVAEVEEVLASGTIEVTGGSAAASSDLTSLTVDSVELLSASIQWRQSNTQTAIDIRNEINSTTTSPNYTADSSGAVVTITAATGTGTGPNGFVVAATVDGAFTATTANLSGGVAAVTPVAQVSTVTLGGTFEEEDHLEIVVGGTSFQATGLSAGTGIYAVTYDGKMYTIFQSLTAFSAVDQARSYIEALDADADGLAEAQSPGGAGNLTLETSDLDVARQVTITSTGNDSGRTFTVTGTDYSGAALSGNVTGPNATTVTTGEDYYRTVSSIAIDAASAGSITAGWSDTLKYSDTGVGFVNLANQREGSETLTSIGVYQGTMALFSARNIQIWDMDVAPANNVFLQSLERVGTRAPRTVLAYGNNDTFFLDETGIRSLRARDSSNTAYVNDVGTAIDPLVVSHIGSLTDDEVSLGVAAIDPTEGRYWLNVGDSIFVFSFFPSSKISAWSRYLPTEVSGSITEMVEHRRTIWVRAGDTIYAYGGAAGSTYPSSGEAVPTVRLPFIDAGKPATHKVLHGVDAALEGDWSVRMYVDPTDLTKVTESIVLTESTYSKHKVPADGKYSHVALEFTGSGGGAKTISSCAVHFDPGEQG